ncbi:MAG: HIT family hydrolase [Bacteroidetes bacterium GWF2_43_63]|nr:MAG: HIT family hydrolase [Bacteroidetes bacterium GWE2_42_42]OFY55561.1 MAG: HIT family hydrolase [Bacteroidetes bacterium GWF2_43_63]HBG71573.1 HIT family protein [Bacteroidales bacterium]HCB62106.1 HIT family protein [Bacteroidales bacterium]HCY22334.1 HIT family protein [Bacteroidales bacterium]
MASVFSKIIAREIPAHIVAETASCIAFLDISPLNYGHTLVVPKTEVDHIFDLEPAALADLMGFAQKVSKAIQKGGWGKRVGVAVIGLEVPHAHIHLVPISGMRDIEFSKEKLKLSNEELHTIAEQIRGNFI